MDPLNREVQNIFDSVRDILLIAGENLRGKAVPCNPAGCGRDPPCNPAGCGRDPPCNPARCGEAMPCDPAGRGRDSPCNPAGYSRKISEFQGILYGMRVKYALQTSSLLLDASVGELKKKSMIPRYYREVSRLDIEYHIGRIVAEISKMIEGEKDEVAKPIRNAIKVYNGMKTSPILAEIEKERYSKCTNCQIEMNVDTARSELRCPRCTMVKPLIGAVFDDAQLYNQEGQKAKSGRFKPNRHYISWMIHVQALEPDEELAGKDNTDPENVCGRKTLERIKEVIRRDNKILLLLTVNDYRSILREIKKTDLYKNIPLIMKKLTGIGPPRLSETTIQNAGVIFGKVVEMGEKKIAPREGRQNYDYYPFYIFKILEYIIPENDLQRRILFYIYIQGEDTVTRDDSDWETICKFIPEIQYRPTDRTITEQYAPSLYQF